jgi:hypothetical protein
VLRRCAWSRNLKNEDVMTWVGSQRHRIKNLYVLYILRNLYVLYILRNLYVLYILRNIYLLYILRKLRAIVISKLRAVLLLHQ